MDGLTPTDPAPVVDSAVPPEPPTTKCSWPMVLLAAVVAGLVAFGIGEFTYKAWLPPKTILAGFQPMEGYTFKDLSTADTKNAVLTYMVTGAVFGLVLGACGGLCRRSGKHAIIGAGTGLVVGGLIGRFATVAVMYAYFRQRELSESDQAFEVFMPFLVHGTIGAVLGLIAAASFVVGMGIRLRLGVPVVVSGLVGGVIGAIIAEVIGVVAFPLSSTDRPIPEFWAPRLISFMAISLVSVILAALATRPRKPRASALTTATPTG